MKLIITSAGKTTDSEIYPRFGRSQHFIEVDEEDGNIISEKCHKNHAYEEPHGAGIHAAQLVADYKAEAIITGMIGPNAKTALEKIGIPAYRAEGQIKKAIESFAKNSLEKITV